MCVLAAKEQDLHCKVTKLVTQMTSLQHE